MMKDAASVARLFEQPPKQFSPTPMWWWTGGKLKSERLCGQLSRFAEGGVFNVGITHFAFSGWAHSNEMEETPFFSEAWWKIYEDVCAEAKRVGVQIWFFDHIGFSGTDRIVDLVRKEPSWGGRLLHRVSVVTDGKAELICPSEGEPMAAFVVPVDDGGRATGMPQSLPLDGRTICWSGTGRHRVMLIYTIPSGLDILQPAAGAGLIDSLHGEYERRLGKYLGSTIIGTYHDELFMLSTWTGAFAETFQKEHGYDLLPQLAALWEDYGVEADRVREDYYKTRAGLAERAFFKPLFEWHEKHGMTGGCDQLGTSRAGIPESTTKYYADYMRTHRWFGAPGCDHQGDAKIHSSLSHLYDRPRVWLEAFHTSGWGGTLEETFDWLLPWLRAGSNLYSPHAVYYDVAGGWQEWASPSTCWRQPYWRHYPQFAKAVTRLCAVLTQGHHVCDIGILYPSSTVQAGLTFEGMTASAQQAQDAYLALIGRMNWNSPAPGVLDRDCRDFDILDDESIQRAVVRDGTLHIGQESFPVVVLPSCTTLEAATEKKLREFSEAGGRIIAVGAAPAGLPCHTVASAEDVTAELADFPRRVDAPVPTLWRRLGDADLLFIPAAYPCASQVQLPPSGDFREPTIKFDPKDYARAMTITVRGVADAAELWDAVTGQRTKLKTTRSGDVVKVTVPFDSNPAAVVVFGGTFAEPALEAKQAAPAVKSQSLDGAWDIEYVQGGADDLPLPVQNWDFDHRIEPAKDWQLVHATYGPYGSWRLAGEQEWRPATYSLTRGVYKDRQHNIILGVHGRVPEEFLYFGSVDEGRVIEFRTTIHSDEARETWLAIGSPTTKEAWLNGEHLVHDGTEFQFMTPVRLQAGRNTLELRLKVVGPRIPVTAFYAFVSDPAWFTRPSWLAMPESQRHSTVIFETEVEVPFEVTKARFQINTSGRAQFLINGTEVGVMGSFGHTLDANAYTRFDGAEYLRPGRNLMQLRILDHGNPIATVLDGLIEGADGQRMTVMTDAAWTTRRDGKEVPTPVSRYPWLGIDWESDSSAKRIWQRPHPLPATGWLERREHPEIVLPVEADAFDDALRVEWFRFAVPPGAISMDLPVEGEEQVFVDGVEVPVTKGHIAVPPSDQLHRICEWRVVPRRGRSGGGVVSGPVTFEVGAGRIELGDWQENGLPAYSGGLRYRRTISVPPGVSLKGALLDLGEVRGTVDVICNGQSAGTRVWSPYQFEIGSLLHEGENHLEILVCNTLAPYLEASTPTPYVFAGQKRSGLFGPVRIFFS